MSTQLLCVLYILYLYITVIRVWLRKTRTNKSYVAIPVLILNPFQPFYSLNTCELKSDSLFQFPHQIFVYASALRVSKCVIFVPYICCSAWPSCEYSWRTPIFIGDGVISSLSLNLVLPSICRFLIYCACCKPDCNVNPLRTKLYLSGLKTQSVPRCKHSLPWL